jgi:hypothetical protein
MLRYRLLRPLGGILVLMLSLLACSSPAQLFATATPVPSDTPTITLTPSATTTPAAPVNLIKCLYNVCPPSTSIEAYLGQNVTPQPNVENYVEIPWSDSVHLFNGWCAIDRTTLDDNLKKIEFFFTINDNSYLDSLQGEYYTIPDPQDSTKTEYCYGVGGVAQNLVIGQSFMIKIGARTTDNINDGWNDYPSGTSYPYIYRVLVVEVPTVTPTPVSTATKTPKPIPTGRMSTPKPACDATDTISIQNETTGPVAITLTGPAYYSFQLSPGPNSFRVCPGTYNYTAWICGGVTSATLNSNGSYRAWCNN